MSDSLSMQEPEKSFQDRIDREIRIEPKDWMPNAYRRSLIRQVQRMKGNSCAKGSAPILAPSN